MKPRHYVYFMLAVSTFVLLLLSHPEEFWWLMLVGLAVALSSIRWARFLLQVSVPDYRYLGERESPQWRQF